MNTTSPSQPENPPLRPAGFFSRLEAWIIDLLLIVISSVVGFGMIKLIIGFFLLPFINKEINIDRFAPLIIIVVVVFYYIFFWALLGFTPGKFLLGLRIVRRNGGKIGLGRAIVRFIGYWVSAIPLFLGYLWIIFDKRQQGWHDKLAGTQVIYTWERKQKAK